MSRLLRLHNTDDVAIALQPINANERIEFEGFSFTTLEDIDKGHKVALSRLLRVSESLNMAPQLVLHLKILILRSGTHTLHQNNIA